SRLQENGGAREPVALGCCRIEETMMLNRRTVLTSALAVTALGGLRNFARAQSARPFKLFDCHAHFYTNEPEKYPFDARTARYGPERMIAKAMANPMTPEVVFKFWEEAGIELGLGVQYSSTYYTDNSYLLDIAAQHPDRIIPIVILDAVDPATPATLERMAREPHCRRARHGKRESGRRLPVAERRRRRRVGARERARLVDHVDAAGEACRCGAPAG